MEGSRLVLYSPNEKWPDHPKAYWRDALDHARRLGWYLNLYDGHAFGQARCNGDLQSTDACTFKVFSSGTAAESAAKDFQKMVERCRHRSQETATQGADARLAKARDHLTKAGRLVEAAEKCAEHDHHRHCVDELVENAAANLGLYDELMRQAIEAEEQAELAAIVARQGLLDAGEVDQPWNVAPIVRIAVRHVSQGERQLRNVRNRPEKRELLQSAQVLRDRMQALVAGTPDEDGTG